MKNFCSTHYFYYTGGTCPYCEKERLEKLSRRFVKETDVNVEKPKDREATKDDLLRLAEKFNNR